MPAPLDWLPITNRPKLRGSISDLATARKRCREAKQAGQECREFDIVIGTREVLVGTWQVGITTVVHRTELLHQTVASLEAGGFRDPHIFTDRSPPLGTFGNWVLGLWEMFIREPTSHYYAMFQDDLMCVQNLRGYLERNPWPDKGYANLFTFLDNEGVIEGKASGTWVEGKIVDGSDPNRTLQAGRSALGLCFTRDGVMALLSARHMVEKAASVLGPKQSQLDGAIVSAMNKAGYREYIHSPSLLQHMGIESVAKPGKRWVGPRAAALTFPGVEFDALSLLSQEQLSG